MFRPSIRSAITKLKVVMSRAAGKTEPAPCGYHSGIDQWLIAIQAGNPSSGIVRHEAFADETLIRNPPVSMYDELHPKFVCELKKESPATFVLEYVNGRCWGMAGTIIGPDNQVLADMSHEFRSRIEDYEIFQQPYLVRPRHLIGTAVVLAAPAGQVFGHFLFDVLPRLGILEKAGFDWRSADHFIISGPFAKFQKETLELLGIESSRIADCCEHSHWTADRMLIPSRPGISGNYTRWAVEYVRDLLLPFEGKVPPGLGSKLFVSRANAPGRKIANETAIMQVLQPMGFSLVRNEELTMPETIAAYQQAEFVIGPMGSSMCSTLFCKPGTKVIELYPDSSVNVFTWAFGQFIPFNFGYSIGASLNDAHTNPHDWNYTVDDKQLRGLLDKMAVD